MTENGNYMSKYEEVLLLFLPKVLMLFLVVEQICIIMGWGVAKTALGKVTEVGRGIFPG